MRFSTLASAAGLLTLAAAQYSLVEDFMSGDFFDHFDFFTGADPTAGWVDYVDYTTAKNGGLVNTQKGAYIGVDSSTNNVQAPGRKSVRLSSNKAYTYMLVVLDLYHQPGGIPGTWPAFWTFGPNWPNGGEIDIIEGVNGQMSNAMTLHLGSSCTLNGGGNGLLKPASTDCNANDNSNEGCSFHDSDPSSYGTGFNSAGGGVFAMEWTTKGVSIWRWGQGSQPGDAFSDSPNPSGWGSPSANWAASDASCDFPSTMSQHNIIFDTTFCGEWAGSVFDGGLQACKDFVSGNPSAFANAYWGVNNLRVYQQGGASTSSDDEPKQSPSSTPVQSPAPVATSFSTLVSPSAAPQPSTSSPSPNAASPSPQPLDSGDFGSGSQGIPASPSPNAEAVATPTPQPLESSEFGAGSQGIPQNPSPNAEAVASSTPQPLEAGDFGSGSQGIPEGSEGWKRAVDMKMGERRRRQHLARHHVRAAKS